MTYYRHLAPALVRAGARVSVIEGSGFGTSGIVNKEIIEGVEVHAIDRKLADHWISKFDHLSQTPSLQRNLAAAWAAWEQAQTLGPIDIVEATDFALLMIPPIVQGMVPVIMQMHASCGQIQTYDPAPGEALSGAISLAVETEALTLVSLAQTYSNQNRDEWLSQRSSSSIDHMLPAWQKSGNKPAHQEVRMEISIFGRIQLWKGPQVLSEALGSFPDCPPINWYGRDVSGSALGPGSTLSRLQNLYPDIWGKKVSTYDPVPPSVVQSLQATSLLNLVPSTWDVFNFTVVEAMASGRPVVCSDRAGASELIDDGVTGFIYDGTSPEALVATLRRALSCPPEELIEIGQAAEARIGSTLNPDKIAGERLRAYQILIDAPKIQAVIPEWLKQIVMPRKQTGGTYAFLDRVPIRPLAGHVFNRIAGKMGLKR